MVDKVDFTITDNADWTFSARLDEDDEPKNLTGASFAMDIREKAEDETPVDTLISGSGQAISIGSPATGGTIAITFEAGSLEAGEYVYDLICTIATVPRLMIRGKIKVLKGVTRDDA